MQVEDVQPEIAGGVQDLFVKRLPESFVLRLIHERITGVLNGVVNTADAGVAGRFHKAQCGFGNRFQSLQKPLWRATHVAQRPLASREVFRLSQWRKDGGDVGYLFPEHVLQPLQNFYLNCQHSFAWIENLESRPIIWRLHSPLCVGARSLRISTPLICHAPIYQAIAAGGRNFYEIPVVILLPFDVCRSHCPGILVVSRPVTPQCNRRSLGLPAGYRRLQAFSLRKVRHRFHTPCHSRPWATRTRYGHPLMHPAQG